VLEEQFRALGKSLNAASAAGVSNLSTRPTPTPTSTGVMQAAVVRDYQPLKTRNLNRSLTAESHRGV
jgi:hypothetical protein